jgi:hypothetical protein
MYRGNTYRTASDVFKFKISPSERNFYTENFQAQQPQQTQQTHQLQAHQSNQIHQQQNIEWKPKDTTLDMRDPEVFGPALWFTLHNGASNYPEEASPIVVEKMKNFILGLPYIISCENCQSHAIAYIEEHYESMCESCKGKDTLFKWFFDFHNYVNKRLGKPQMKLEDAINLYSSNSKIRVMKY